MAYTGARYEKFTGNTSDYKLEYVYAFSINMRTGEWSRIPVNPKHRLDDKLFEVEDDGKC